MGSLHRIFDENCSHLITLDEKQIPSLITSLMRASGYCPYTRMVSEFMTTGGQDTNNQPTVGTMARAHLNTTLIVEESLEYVEATQVNRSIGDIADAVADILYIAFGLAVYHGLPIYELFEEVHRSNMTKTFPDGTFHRNEKGKIVKPDSFTPPELTAILSKYGANQLKKGE